MFDFSNTIMSDIVVHKVGNKLREEKLQLSKQPLNLDDSIKELLHSYFLTPFKSEACYQFAHESNLSLNEVYNYASQIFGNNEVFFEQSINIARHLFNESNHPKIKDGEFYAVKFRDCVIDDEICDAIGLFKSENKDTYIKVYQQNENFEIVSDSGVNIKKLDKGCLIFNTEQGTGYKIFIVDNLNKSGEAQFWRDNFLKIQLRNDDYSHTQNYLNVCKGFVTNIYNQENQVERPDQIDLLNRSVNFFKEKNFFDASEFEEDVMGDSAETKNAFSEYKKQYSEENNIALNDGFNISNNAVKINQRHFKSVLKLDKNFHIYIHGDRNNIVKGWDSEKKRHFYKLYFEEES